MNFAKPNSPYPVKLADGTDHKGTVFLKAVIDHPCIEIGDYTYASAFDPPSNWVERLAPYLFDFSPEKLVIGKFCQIADGVQFITSSANHRYDGFSSFPFFIFDDLPNEGRPSMPEPGRDTIIGNDVWLGKDAIILPGAKIGNGVIVGAGAVVSGQIPDYAMVTGNPAGIHRMRFLEHEIEALIATAWWDWDIDRIVQNEAAICGRDFEALLAVQKEIQG